MLYNSGALLPRFSEEKMIANEKANDWTEQQLGEALGKVWTDPIKHPKSGVASLSAASTRVASQSSLISANTIQSFASLGEVAGYSSDDEEVKAVQAEAELTVKTESPKQGKSPKAPKTLGGVGPPPLSHWSPSPGASPCPSSNCSSDKEEETPTAVAAQTKKKSPKAKEQYRGPSPKSHWSPSPGASPCPSSTFNSDTEEEKKQKAKKQHRGPSPKSHWSPSPGASEVDSDSEGFGSDSDEEGEEVAPKEEVEKKALANKWSASAENLVLADSDSDSGSDSYSDSSPRTPHVFSKVPDPPPAGAPSQRRRSGAVTEAMIKQIGNNQLDGEGKAGENEIKLNKDKPPVFDTLTIRTWFMMADKDNSGSISKKEFIQFLIDNKQLATMLMQKLGDKDGEHTLEWFVKKFQETEHQRVARVYRRLLGFYKTIDADKNGSLEFNEFLDLFQRAGVVLEYQSEDNPRDRAADYLESLEGTGPIANVRFESQQARRGSETLWALSQRAMFATDFKKDLAPRRHSTQCFFQNQRNKVDIVGPSDFWNATLVLGSNVKRRSSWGPTGNMESPRRRSYGGAIV